MKTTFECMFGDTVAVEVGTDGLSLPVLTIWFKAGTKKSFVLLDKEQATKLTYKLQSLITEM